ncbi:MULTISPECIES: hypothetical protein [unclassified Mesorhizobium]|uniref:acyltransferase family protein n=1 Tax=unclassified Mesorhizobium TaxID=325217 RepID=UPI00333DC52E
MDALIRVPGLPADPFVFLAYRRFGKTVFLGALLTVFVYCFLARMTVYSLGASHPIIWVTPFLRPESVLCGMALYILRPQWHWGVSIAVAVVAGAAFLSLAPPWVSPVASAFSYPLAALMFGGLVDAGLRAPLLATVLSATPLRFLGRISYGLYVYHFAVIAYSVGTATKARGHAIAPATNAGDYWTLWATALMLTIVAATISYFAFEKWVAMYKVRFAAVEGRAA